MLINALEREREALRKAGLEEGRVEGRVEGRMEGELRRNREIVAAMVERGFDLDVIADVTKLGPDEIQALLDAQDDVDDLR